MQRWQKWDNDLCPRCGLMEDVPHVIACRGTGADDVWKRSIDALRQWMETHQTDPEIINNVVNGLRNWREGLSLPMSYTSNISVATQQQNDISWQAMAEGCTTE
jgi:hypothetical protein